MMTRETKAGLVVSCSFLALVGVVIYSKWSDGESTDAPDADLVALAESLDAPQPSEESEAAGPSDNARRSSAPAPVAAPTPTLPASAPVLSVPAPGHATPTTPASRTTAPSTSDDWHIPDAPSAGPTTTTPAVPASRPTPPEPEPTTPAPAPSAPLTTAIPTAGAPTSGTLTPATGTPLASDTAPAPAPTSEPPLPEPTGGRDTTAPPVGAASSGTNTAPAPSSEPPSAAAATTTGGTATTPAAPARHATEVKPFEPEPPPELPGFTKKKFELPPPPSGRLDSQRESINRTPTATTPTSPASSGRDITPTVTPSPGATNPPATGGPGANLLRPVTPGGLPASDPTASIVPTRPAVDEAQLAQSRPVAGPGSPNQIVPKVEAYDELIYRCKPADVTDRKVVDTFAAISNLYFQNDRFGQALLLFNREHPRAADGLRHEPPVLQPGATVFIPPQRILEKKYAAVIPGYAPLPAPAAAPVGAPPVGLAPPRTTGGNTSWPNPVPDKPYRVRKGGEMLRDIAGRTLGNRERWAEIYKLNMRANFNPGYPVPEGTVLRLPGEARVEPIDTP